MKKYLLPLILILLLTFTVIGYCVTELDYMEYANDVDAQAAYVTSNTGILSNADIDDEDMADLSEWATSNVSQVTFDGKSSMKLETTDNIASSLQDIGAFGNRTVFSLSVYCIGIKADENFQINMYNGSTRLLIRWSSVGIRIHDGSSYIEVGSGLFIEDIWQEWTFDADWVAETIDVYLDGVLRASDMDFSFASGTDNGTIDIIQYGTDGNTETTYIDWFKAGSSTTSNPNFPGLQSYSEDTIKEQGTYSLKGIARLIDSTLTRTVNPTIDLTDQTRIKYDIRGSRTGSQIKIGIHDSGGATSEHTANIASANTWQTETWSISGVSNANKDVINSIIITIVNADAANTFYIDNMYAETEVVAVNAIFFGTNF